MTKNESAVSPVVGIMLMLVVTIIIAAIVSAFAGGAVSGTSKAPQAAIQGTYSQATGMTISHAGGDAIPLATTKVLVRPSTGFGTDAARYSWTVNKSYVFTNATQTWKDVRVFMPGETVTIHKDNLSYVQQRPDGSTDDSTDSNYGFEDHNNLGLSFILEFQDVSGKTIANSVVTITK
jgi:archaeal type IV pilus assembly protein PilA